MDAADIDFRPLSAPVSRETIRAAKVAALAGELGKSTQRQAKIDSGSCALIIGFACAGLGFVAMATVSVVLWAHVASGGGPAIFLSSVCTIAALLLAYSLYRLFLNVYAPPQWAHAARLLAFGRANGFDVIPRADASRAPGQLRRHQNMGTSWVADEVRWTQRGRAARTGVYHSYDARGGRGSSRAVIRYLSIDIDGGPQDRIFQMVAGIKAPIEQSHAAHGPKWVNVLPTKKPRLTCPPDGVSHVRAYFTDEVIEALTRLRANAHFVSGRLIAYRAAGDSLDPNLWKQMMSLVDAVDAIVPPQNV
ncbi:hypothetical protein [Rudaeicoccus suwonensis]|uniref:Uncharacterized protein n=1 Tax=Rudaeicoccus suwonensis TaxID=657409 RepID=A0A561E9Q0_9MICO|nr:hypothetical protein [Rudaeicoccus suwonensis]TWE12317.1 hypothetical protein BKA23_1118 [Rudaeicoccus suwonensis]